MSIVGGVVRYRWAILVVAFLGQWGGAMAGKVIGPLAPLFQPELGLTKAEVGLFASAAFAGALAVLLIGGSLTDRFGIRMVVSLGQVVTGILLFAMSAVGSVVQAAAVMFAVGLGRGMVFPGTTKAVLEWFPPRERATAMGLKQMGAPVSGIVAAATMPILGLMVGWRSAIAAVGFLIIASGIVAAVLYRNPGKPGPKAAPKAEMGAGLKDTLRNDRLWALGFVAILFVMAQQALVLYLPLYFTESVLVLTVPDEATRIVAAGGYLALCQLGGSLGRPMWGVVSDRVFQGQRCVVLVIIGVLGAITLLAVGWLGSNPECPLSLVGAVVFAAGLSSVAWNGVFHTGISEAVGRKYAATGVGLGMTMVECGTTVGPPLFGFLVDVTSYRTAWIFAAAFSAAGALMAAMAARGERRGPLSE